MEFTQFKKNPWIPWRVYLLGFEWQKLEVQASRFVHHLRFRTGQTVEGMGLLTSLLLSGDDDRYKLVILVALVIMSLFGHRQVCFMEHFSKVNRAEVLLFLHQSLR